MTPPPTAASTPSTSQPTTGPHRWVELCRHETCADAITIVTSVAAMEFDARVINERGRCVTLTPDCCGPSIDPPHDDRSGSYIVQVRVCDWRDLNDVLPDLIDEQEAFDRSFRNRETARLVIGVSAGVIGIVVGGVVVSRGISQLLR